MELRHLRYIVTVAEELHFGRAAIRLNISQPPLSQQIKQAEDHLGIKIFHRNRREVRVTEAGKRIVTEAYRVLSQMDHLENMATQASKGEIGHISVGTLAGVNQILARTLSSFAKRFPGVHLELQYMSTGEQIEALREGRIQVGFLSLPIHQETLIAEPVRTEPLLIALPKNHPLTQCRQVALKDLADQPLISLPRRFTPGLYDLIVGTCQKAGFNLQVAHEVDSTATALMFVQANLGYAFCAASLQTKANDIVYRP